MEMSAKTSSGWLFVRTGTEGPRHDPYGYTETTVERLGHTVTIHEGLGVWVSLDNHRVAFKGSALDYEVQAQDAFRLATHFTPRQVRKFIDRAKGRCKKCGGRSFDEVNGYPGETLFVCTACGHINGGRFDRSAIE